MNEARVRWEYNAERFLSATVPDLRKRTFAYRLACHELNMRWTRRMFVVKRSALRKARNKQFANIISFSRH